MALLDILFQEGDIQEFIVELPDSTSVGTPNDVLYDSVSGMNIEVSTVQVSASYVF